MESETYFITPQGWSAISSTAKCLSSSSPSSPWRAPSITGAVAGTKLPTCLSYGQPGHLLFSLMSVPLGTRILYGLVLCLPCPESVCLQLFVEQVWCGWREMMCILQVTPYPSLLPFHECGVNVWRAGTGGGRAPPHTPPRCGPLQALGLWVAYVWGSSFHPCSCCLSRCQNSVLLQGLNFWKPIKCAFCGWGQEPLDVGPAPWLAPRPLPVEHRGLDLAGPW